MGFSKIDFDAISYNGIEDTPKTNPFFKEQAERVFKMSRAQIKGEICSVWDKFMLGEWGLPCKRGEDRNKEYYFIYYYETLKYFLKKDEKESLFCEELKND